MPRLWVWENGDTAILDMPPLGRGQWVRNCIYCGKIPEIREDNRIFCTNTNCVNNKSYSLAEWNKKEETDFQNPSYESISLEERVKRLEERMQKIDGITMY